MKINYVVYLCFSLLYVIESMNITNYHKMLLGANNTFQVDQGCHEIIIPNNYKKLILNLNSTNIYSILITDSKVGNCVENYNLTQCCAKNSTFCIENKIPTTNKINLNYCIRQTNLYACLKPVQTDGRRLQADALAIAEAAILANYPDANFTNMNRNTDSTQNNSSDMFILPATIDSGPGSVVITTSIIKDEGCQTAEFIPEAACSTLGLQNCKDPNFCSNKCMYVECRTEIDNPGARVFSMCLPLNLTDGDITNRCRNHVTFSQNQPFVYKKVCENTNNHDHSDITNTGSHKFFKFLLFIMGAVVIILFIASVYYRFSKKYNDGIPPFEAPWFFPNFVFPK